MMMRTAIVFVALAAATLAVASDVCASPDPAIEPVELERDAFHVQPPTYYLNVSASTSHSSEVADDVPQALAGMSAGRIRLYAAEWLAAWINPEALVINVYDGQCPPLLDASASYTIPWEELTTELVLEQSPRTVYMVDAMLDPPFAITSNTSIGVYCVNGWPEQPYTGVCLTEPDDVYGCGQAYWFYPGGGYPGWTPMSVGIGYEADLAYSLWEPDTGIPDGEPGSVVTTWGVVKELYRFDPTP